MTHLNALVLYHENMSYMNTRLTSVLKRQAGVVTDVLRDAIAMLTIQHAFDARKDVTMICVLCASGLLLTQWPKRCLRQNHNLAALECALVASTAHAQVSLTPASERLMTINCQVVVGHIWFSLHLWSELCKIAQATTKANRARLRQQMTTMRKQPRARFYSDLA